MFQCGIKGNWTLDWIVPVGPKGHGLMPGFISLPKQIHLMGNQEVYRIICFCFMIHLHAVIAKRPGSRCAKIDKTWSSLHQDGKKCSIAVKASWSILFSWYWLHNGWREHLLLLRQWNLFHVFPLYHSSHRFCELQDHSQWLICLTNNLLPCIQRLKLYIYIHMPYLKP